MSGCCWWQVLRVGCVGRSVVSGGALLPVFLVCGDEDKIVLLSFVRGLFVSRGGLRVSRSGHRHRVCELDARSTVPMMSYLSALSS